MRYVFVLSSLVLITSCATTFRPWKLSEVQEGMNRSQVITILGEPDLSFATNGTEHLQYTYREDYNPSMDPMTEFDAERALSDLEKRQAFKEYSYEVILVDGKVINYKEITK